MSEHRTLILDEEEGPTMVDVRSARTACVRASTDPTAASQDERLRRMRVAVGAALVLLFSIGLLAVAWQGRRNSNALRQVLQELRRDRGVAGAADPGPAGGLGGLGPAAHEDEGAPHESVGGSRQELETRAASALSANDYRGSLAIYSALARVAPQEPAFSHLVTILEARLRCSVRDEATGLPCP